MIMKLTGIIRKMATKLTEPVEYYLPIGENQVGLNQLLNHKITLRFQGEIICIDCGKQTKKSFAQGFCYPCFMSSPLTSECILKPELCLAHEGVARDMEWAEEHCLKNHYVYLSRTAGMKVGVTRSHQIPTRWIDQGAVEALQFAKTPNRYLAGAIEVALKEHISDRTAWQRMLKNDVDYSITLVDAAQKLELHLDSIYHDYILNDSELVEIEYPVIQYPEKVKSLSFDKQAEISGTLIGMKGQYLYLNENQVLNIRKHTGYVIELETDKIILSI